MNDDVRSLTIDEWVVRWRPPLDGQAPQPVLMLLHGWKGDENVMWIFASRLPSDALIIAPRAIYATPDGGFGWHLQRGETPFRVEDFSPAVEALLAFLPELQGRIEAEMAPVTPSGQLFDFSSINWLGFSQGAALVYTLALLHPERVGKLGGLAGFMPEGADSLAASQPLKGKQAFVAHGSEDETVPIELARHAVETLENAGAHVTFCEDAVGHKLSLTCFRSLDSFFKS
ncbi:MAG: hypothetical protein EHM70_06620 [Chloroflexota bacterium]|nr:MAG: hypothetical protein EHM70_06620 [Chloroflexota bacterium]